MPLVAMTREMGSLGKDVAAQLSQRLGRELVHHEIIGVLADKMRLRKSHVVRFLEGKAGIWERMTTDKTSLAIYTGDETLKLLESGRVGVLRGWGAAHLLRAVPHVLCVRICAPFEVRVERMMHRLDAANRDVVETEIKLSDEAHGAITKRHFGIDWREPEHYDLVLNTARVSVEQCVEQIAGLLKAPQFQETAESQRLFSDLSLQYHVRAALRQDARTAKLNVVVETANGHVSLVGMLDSGVKEADAMDVVSGVPGVSGVESKLRAIDARTFKIGG